MGETERVVASERKGFRLFWPRLSAVSRFRRVSADVRGRLFSTSYSQDKEPDVALEFRTLFSHCRNVHKLPRNLSHSAGSPFFKVHISVILCDVTRGTDGDITSGQVSVPTLSSPLFSSVQLRLHFIFHLQAVNRGLTGSWRFVAVVC